jgi:hypothetical protein
MIVLYIIAGIVFLISVLLFSSIRLYLSWNDSVGIKLGFWFIKLDLLKLLERKPNPKPKTEKKKKAPVPEKAQEKKKRSFSDILGFVKFITRILKRALKELSAALKIKIKKLDISVATSSPDKTAILFGSVCSAVYQLCEIVNRFTRSEIDPTKIKIHSDFLSQSFKAELDMVISLRIIDIVRTGGSVLLMLTELKKGVNSNE